MAKKKQLSNKQIAKKLKSAKRVEKSLQDLKKSKDVYFRNRAINEESLLPVTDLNAEIRSKSKQLKGKKSDIKAQQNKVKKLESNNRKINKKRKQLEKQYEFEDEEGKKLIEKELKSPDLRTKDLFIDKNYLKALQGKDFDYIINDGFKKYRINVKDLKKYWNKGGDATLPILKKMQKDAKVAIKYYDKLIKKEKNVSSKARLKKLNRIKSALENKLSHTIDKNIEAIETGNMKALDEYNEQGEKAYSLLFRVVGFSIDKATV